MIYSSADIVWTFQEYLDGKRYNHGTTILIWKKDPLKKQPEEHSNFKKKKNN